MGNNFPAFSHIAESMLWKIGQWLNVDANEIKGFLLMFLGPCGRDGIENGRGQMATQIHDDMIERSNVPLTNVLPIECE